MKTFILSAMLILAGLFMVACDKTANKTNGNPNLKIVTVSEFMNNSLSKKIPVQFKIPEHYDYADVGSPITYSYWMPKNKIQLVKTTRNMPVDTGYMYGKVSLSIAYDKTTRKFIGVEKLKQHAQAGGFSNVKFTRVEVGGYPVLFIEMKQKKTGKQLYSLYLGMQLATNTLYITYRPPANKPAVGFYVWESFKKSMTKTN